MENKKDKFVIAYSAIWIIAALIILSLLKKEQYDSFVVLFNTCFIGITASFVFIKPIRKFLEEKIIEKLF